MASTTHRLVVGVLVGLLATSLGAPTVVAGATATTVSLSPADGTVTSGETVTFSVVVENAEGGVGAYNATLSIADPDAATITDVSLSGSPSLEEVELADDGSTVTIRAALMDTADAGSVTVATVTVEGSTAGETDVTLDVAALGDETGNSYEVTGTPEATLSVGTAFGDGDGDSGDDASDADGDAAPDAPDDADGDAAPDAPTDAPDDAGQAGTPQTPPSTPGDERTSPTSDEEGPSPEQSALTATPPVEIGGGPDLGVLAIVVLALVLGLLSIVRRIRT